MSYGVIAIKAATVAPVTATPATVTAAVTKATNAVVVDTKVPQYLLIRRKDSLSYVEFLRGKYKLTNHAYIQLLLNEMTTEERVRLQTMPFPEMWYALWSGQHTRQFRNESDAARVLFESFRDKGDSSGKPLASYIEACTHHYAEPEWGFPKGRRNIHESDMRCAVREWCEETGLPESALQVLATAPCEEVYTGSNGIPYKQMYYIGKCAETTAATMATENCVMTREISGIRWCSIDEAMGLLRVTNPVKRELLQQIHRRVVVGDLRYLLL